MNSSLGTLQNTNRDLDNLHTIKILLNNLPQISETNSDNYSNTLENLPQVCVFGAQSSGKSSVLSRLTGIKFPSQSGTCSRVPTHIISRRKNYDNLSILLQSVANPISSQIIFETTNKSDQQIEKYLKIAQNRALELSSNKKFVTDYIITIHVAGANILNSNLVDLPGFNTENETDKITVENICKKYLRMKGTIALHVCRSDVDHNSQAGNDIIKSFPDLQKILIMTYCDKITNSDVVEIVNKTLLNNKKYKCIAVLSNSNESNTGEEEKLQRTLGRYNFNQLCMGTQILMDEIERLMSIHINKQFPELKKNLTSELKYYKNELKNINTETPIDIYLRNLSMIEKNLNEQKKDIENKLRYAFEDMKSKILNSNIRINEGTKIYDPITDGHLQTGMIIDIKEPKETKSFFKTTEQFTERNNEKRKNNNTGFFPSFIDYNGTTNTINANKLKQKQQNQSNQSNQLNANINNLKQMEYGKWKHDNVISSISNGIMTFENDTKEYVIENCIIGIKENEKKEVVHKIKQIIDENRGLVNTGHTDITPAIMYFATEFAKDYASILGEFTSILTNIMNKYVDDIFNIHVESYITPALNRKKQDFIDQINENKDKLSERIMDLVRSNMGPILYTSNEYELNLAYNEMTQNKVFDDENGALEQIYFRAKAYLKCQKSYVIESATRNAMLLLYCDTFDNIKQNMYINLKEYSELIEFPLERQSRINELTNYINTINQILEMI